MESAAATSEIGQHTRALVIASLRKIEFSIPEQSSAKETIMVAAKRLMDLASQFRMATGDQTKVGRAISDSTVDVSAISRKIETACAEQAQERLQIAAAVAGIDTDADKCLRAAALLEAGGNHLVDQVGVLQQGTAAFRV